MNFNELVNNLNWKKIAVVLIGIMLVSWVTREIVFWSIFHEFNKQFHETENAINKKLVDSENDFDKRSKELDERAKKFDEYVQNNMTQTQDFFNQTEKEVLERDKALTQTFKDAPKKMLAQHVQFRKDMEQHFFHENKKMHEDFKINVMNVDKTLEATRCNIAIGSRPDDATAPKGLTAQQLQDRKNNIMKIRREIAKKENCEAYL